MTEQFCEFHQYGLDIPNSHEGAEIWCKDCRAEGHFSPEQLRAFEIECCRLVARYQRPLGYPNALVVILRDEDTEALAESICPQGRWKLASLTRSNPNIKHHNNEIRVERPTDGMTLEDFRKTWDFAPGYCY